MKADEIRSGRLRSMMNQATKVKSYEELVAYAVGRFQVTKRTAEDYADSVIEFYKQQEERKKHD